MKQEDVFVESTGVIGHRIKKVSAETLCIGFYLLLVHVFVMVFWDMDYTFTNVWTNHLKTGLTSLFDQLFDKSCCFNVICFSFPLQGALLNSLPKLVNSLSSSVEG